MADSGLEQRNRRLIAILLAVFFALLGLSVLLIWLRSPAGA